MKAFEKALIALERLAAQGAPMSVRELAAATNESLSSAQRAAYTLEALGYFERAPGDRKLALGRACLVPAGGYLAHCAWVARAGPPLLGLAERFGLRGDVAVPAWPDIRYLARYVTENDVHRLATIGRRWPAFATASGRAMLAALPRSEAARILDGSEIRAITPLTIVDRDRIARAIDEAREAGFAWQSEEVLRGAASVAVAARSRDGGPIGAALLGGPPERFARAEDRRSYADALSGLIDGLGALE